MSHSYMSFQRLGVIIALAVALTPISVSGQVQSTQEHNPEPSEPSTKLPLSVRPITPVTDRNPASITSTENLEISTPLPGLRTIYKINFQDFMKNLYSSNISLAAQRFNVPIAHAQLRAAGIYPDPTFQAGYGGDVSNERQPSNYSGGLTQIILLGGKIGARTDVAKSALRGSRAQLSEYQRNLQVQAANTFIDGLAGLLILQRKSLALMRAEQLVETSAKRLAAKKIKEDEMLRTRIAALEAHNDLISAESTVHQTLANMSLLLGTQQRTGLLSPVGNLDIPQRTFVIEDLIARAISSRSDVIAAGIALETARGQYRLARANRIPDLTVGGTYQHLTRATSPIDPAPAWDSVGVTVSIPLPLSDINSGNVEAAYYAQLQAEAVLQAAKLQAEADVRIAYERYTLAVAAVKQFEIEVLHDADDLYKSRLFRMGGEESSLVDVLNAHQAINQLYVDYYNALSEQAKALVALESSAGLWDIDF